MLAMGSTHHSDVASGCPSAAPCPLGSQHTDLSAGDYCADCAAAAADHAALVAAADDLQGLMHDVANFDLCFQVVLHLLVKQQQWAFHLAVCGVLVVHQLLVQARKQLVGLRVGLRGV